MFVVRDKSKAANDRCRQSRPAAAAADPASLPWLSRWLDADDGRSAVRALAPRAEQLQLGVLARLGLPRVQMCLRCTSATSAPTASPATPCTSPAALCAASASAESIASSARDKVLLGALLVDHFTRALGGCRGGCYCGSLAWRVGSQNGHANLAQ